MSAPIIAYSSQYALINAVRRFGVNWHGPMSGIVDETGQVNAAEIALLQRMSNAGIRLLRIGFNQWFYKEAAAATGNALLPFEQFMHETNSRKIQVIPILIYHDEENGPYIPQDGPALGAWQEFVRSLVSRFGTYGSFWAEPRPYRFPLQIWEVWNEPNLPVFGFLKEGVDPPETDPGRYFRFLKDTWVAVRRRPDGSVLDDRGRIMFAGLAGRDNDAPGWITRAMGTAASGSSGWCEAVGLHPYDTNTMDVEAQIRDFRTTLDRIDDGGGSALQLWPTEVGWTSRLEDNLNDDCDTVPRTSNMENQAAKVDALQDRLAPMYREQLGLGPTLWWMARDGPTCRAGLWNTTGDVVKAAGSRWAAYARQARDRRLPPVR